MGDKGIVTFVNTNPSGDIQPSGTGVFIVPMGGTPGGPSAVQMTDSDANGTYIVDIEDDGLDSGLYDIYVSGVLEIDSHTVVSKDLIDDVVAYGVSITDHESSITSINSEITTITGNISSLQGSVSTLVTDVAGVSGSLNTHLADSTDPHGPTLAQTLVLSSALYGVSGDSTVVLAGKNAANPIEFDVKNYGSPSGYSANIKLTKGEIKFGGSGVRQYISTNQFVLDVKNSDNSELQIFNSEANKSCKLILDGGASIDVDEVVTARLGFSSLNERLNAISNDLSPFAAHVFENMSALQGWNDSSDGGVTNRIYTMIINLPFSLSINRVRVFAPTADTTANSAFGMYNANGDLVFQASNETISINENAIGLDASYLVSPGEYYLAWTMKALNASLKGYAQDADITQRWGLIATGGGSALPEKLRIVDIVAGGNAFFPYMVLDSANF